MENNMKSLIGAKIIAIWEAIIGLMIAGIGVLVFCLGIYTAITGKNLTNLSDQIGGAGSDIGAQTFTVAIMMAIFSIPALLIGIFFLLVARGVWKQKKWAWFAALIINILNVLYSIFSTISSVVSGAEGLVLQFIGAGAGIVIALAIIVYLLLPNVRAAFFNQQMN
jgi:lysylphosphatidylglycerol synthetase-like protein (DUF2156 family)